MTMMTMTTSYLTLEVPVSLIMTVFCRIQFREIIPTERLLKLKGGDKTTERVMSIRPKTMRKFCKTCLTMMK